MNNTFILTGTLRVHYVNGRNGRFPIATLHAPVGTFRVRSKWVEQFEDGEYQGQFAVSEFSLYTFQVYDESRTAIGIQVSEYWLDNVEVGTVADEATVYPDPVEEETPIPKVITTEPEIEEEPEPVVNLEKGEPDDEGYTPLSAGGVVIAMTRHSSVHDEPEKFINDHIEFVTVGDSQAPAQNNDANSEEIALLQSFDLGWTNGTPYKIDSTLSRAEIRQCHAALMKLGYRFEPKKQIYCLGGEKWVA